jgi:hypothetical protein
MTPFLDLPWRSCKWPVAEQGGKHLFCGVPLGPEVDERCFYCAEHAPLSLNPDGRKWRDLQSSADVLTRGERIPRGPDDERLRDLVEEIGE